MFRSLRYPNFRLFFFGQFVSLCGSWVQGTALAWLVYRLTRDPFMLGLVNFVNQFPVFLLGFYAGHAVDRHNRLRIVLLMQTFAMLQAGLMAALTLTGRIQVWHVFVLALMLGFVYAFDVPARQVLIGELVDPSDRHNAIALNSTIVNGSRILGPAIAGYLIGWVGEGWCFALNAASYLSVIGGLLLMRGVRQTPSQSSGTPWEEIGNGLAYAMGEGAIRRVLGVLAVFSLAGLPLYVLLPIFAEEVLRSGAQGLGILSSLSGLGATVGALVLARRPTTTGLGWIIPGALVLFGGALAALAVSRLFWLSAGLMFLAGLAAINVLAGCNTVLQELAGDRYRGRIMSFYSMLFIGVSPVGSFMAGGLARSFGVTATALLQAAVCAACGLWGLKRLPRLLGPVTRAAAGPSRPGAEIEPV